MTLDQAITLMDAWNDNPYETVYAVSLDCVVAGDMRSYLIAEKDRGWICHALAGFSQEWFRDSVKHSTCYPMDIFSDFDNADANWRVITLDELWDFNRTPSNDIIVLKGLWHEAAKSDWNAGRPV